MNKKYNHIISSALRDTKTYNFYFSKGNHFSKTFNSLTPKERDLHCSHQIMSRTKQTHTYTYYKFIQHHYTTKTQSQNPHHRFQIINSKYTSQFFLNFTQCIKDTNMQGIFRNYDHIRQMYIFCPNVYKINKHLKCFGHYYKLNISPAYLLNFYDIFHNEFFADD